MAINQAYPSMNGIEPSWADIAVNLSVNGPPGAGGSLGSTGLLAMADIKGIKWGRAVEVGERRGASGGRVMARTTGKGSQTASMTLYRPGLRTLKRNLIPSAPTRGSQRIISLVAFDVNIQFSPPGDTDIHQVVLKGCRYVKDDEDSKDDSVDPQAIEVELSVIEIADIIDGVEVVLL